MIAPLYVFTSTMTHRMICHIDNWLVIDKQLYILKFHYLELFEQYLYPCCMLYSHILSFTRWQNHKFPRSNISNTCISFDLTPLISASSALVIRKPSTYKHMMTRLSLLALLRYTPYSETNFDKPTLTRKLSILLFQALGTYTKPQRAFLNLYTFDSWPLISNPVGWLT